MREWKLSKEDIWISVVHENGSRTSFNVRYIEDGSNLMEYEVHFKRINEIITSFFLVTTIRCVCRRRCVFFKPST